jgi:L-ascorbate metabolism protein UlaG (beta-lactamase superfamily)
VRLTHLGHACLLVEAAGARLLIDPGSFSSGFEQLGDLDAVLVTHQHADHVDADRLAALLGANPEAAVCAEPQTARQLSDQSGLGAAVRPFAAGDAVTFGGLQVEGVGGDHAVIHPDVPRVGNTGLVLSADGEPTLFHPGDAYDTAPEGIDVLAVPLCAPWAKLAETVEFARAVSPATAVPIHDALLTGAARGLYAGHVERLGPQGMRLLDLAGAGPTEV